MKLAKDHKKWIKIGGIVLLIFLVLNWNVSTYNSLVSLNEFATKEWKNLEVQYQRRFDLMGNLAQAVTSYKDFESKTFSNIASLRTQWQKGSLNEKELAVQGLDSTFSRLLVTVENYPQLKASALFQDFMAEWSGTENRVATSRKDYNEAVNKYNIKVKTFPSNMLAKVFGFKPKEGFAPPTYFESEKGSEKAPKTQV